MDELITIIRLCRPETRADRATIRECANIIREKLHFAEKQRQRIAAEALVMLHGVSETTTRPKT